MAQQLQQEFRLGPDSHIHVVGIGGAGMSAVARILLDRGFAVSGSDRQANDITADLARRGAVVFEGHRAENIAGANVLFVSSAVHDDNPEIVAAKAAGLPILTRREFFRQLLPDKAQIAVAGTHGKTTTTGMIIHLLRETGGDPSYIIGGKLTSTGDNAHVGQGRAFIIEADEYGGMFLGLTPLVAVITNIEHDHPDIFPTLGDVINAFREFAALLPADGTLIACADDKLAVTLADIRALRGEPAATYGILDPGVKWQAILLPSDDPTLSRFTVRHGGRDYPAALLLPGTHNVLNALAALAAVDAFGIPAEIAIPHLATFTGTGRRFELMGQCAGVSVLSDYGHHPTAIRATLQATRQRYPRAAIWAVWQPHTYSRARTLAAEFASAFADADHVLITDIYAAREQPTAGDPTSRDLARFVTATGHPDARACGDLAATSVILDREIQPGAVVIILSAGDAPQVGIDLLAVLRKRAGQ